MKSKIAQSARYSALVAATLCALSGCASAPKTNVENVDAQVKVYGPDQLVQGQYEHVRYLWADSWRTAFWLPSAAGEAEGIAALQTAAARLGANGLISVSCIDQVKPSRSGEPSMLCYGHAIRVHQ